MSSYFDIWYNKEENRFEHGHLRLRPEHRCKGYGRMLVEAREDLARKLGCERIRINMNTNKPFWEHMGYRQNGMYWEKKIDT